MKNLRTIQADSMPAAIAEVKRTLGSDAVILHTRTVERRALLGIGKRRIVEVTAAAGSSSLPRPNPAVSVDGGDRRKPATVLKPAMGPPAEGAAHTMPAVMDDISVRDDRSVRDSIAARDLRTLRADIDELKRLVARRAGPAPAASANALPAELREAYSALVGNEVACEIADELTARVQAELDAVSLRDPARVRARLAEFVADMLPSAGEIDLAAGSGPRIVALVGGTGVGKTTTIAKLAADCRLRRNLRAGIVNLDTRRIGADQQLQVYAEIIGVPLELASTADSLRGALARLGDCDLVLIDTPGCNPRDPGAIAELTALLRSTGACETHLVLPANGARSALLATAEAFAALGIDRVLFTKLDEAIGCGVILECLRRTSAQLSYIATGPNVASDLQIAVSERMASLVISADVRRPGVEAWA